MQVEVVLATELFAAMWTREPIGHINLLAMVFHSMIVKVALGSEDCSASVTDVVLEPVSNHLSNDLWMDLEAKCL